MIGLALASTFFDTQAVFYLKHTLDYCVMHNIHDIEWVPPTEYKMEALCLLNIFGCCRGQHYIVFGEKIPVSTPFLTSQTRGVLYWIHNSLIWHTSLKNTGSAVGV